MFMHRSRQLPSVVMLSSAEQAWFGRVGVPEEPHTALRDADKQYRSRKRRLEHANFCSRAN